MPSYTGRCEGRDGQIVNAGDSSLQVMHTPGHSSDSICLYCQAEKALFTGDNQLTIRNAGGVFSPEYVETLRRLAALRIDKVYSGHDKPLTSHVRETILATLACVQKSCG
ncbi:MAG: MBL fold metallo-hydrolase [Desulfobulbaceae bacterium]|nr:MBL fold metallo-hydrolase [Desulfobulbaceae bacterium]